MNMRPLSAFGLPSSTTSPSPFPSQHITSDESTHAPASSSHAAEESANRAQFGTTFAAPSRLAELADHNQYHNNNNSSSADYASPAATATTATLAPTSPGGYYSTTSSAASSPAALTPAQMPPSALTASPLTLGPSSSSTTPQKINTSAANSTSAGGAGAPGSDIYLPPQLLLPLDTAAAAASTPPMAGSPSAVGVGGLESPPASPMSLARGSARKRTVNDFKFGATLGEGSYSTVVLGTEIATGKEYAIKILDKKHIIREKKTKYVNVEKDVLNKLSHPFTIRLYYTFQDANSLYFVLDLAANGELLEHLKKLGSLDEECTRFYAAEILVAVEYLHSLNIIHRDLKPENILLDANMHIKITDFGTAKILDKNDETGDKLTRANSFVGTAEYVSPELLTDKSACKTSDLWAFGCIIYQLLSGRPPFKGANEYQTFRKIEKLEYSFPDGFPIVARDLVEKLLVLDPSKRLGHDNIQAVKDHPFFHGVAFDQLHTQTPPVLKPFLLLSSDSPAPTRRLDVPSNRGHMKSKSHDSRIIPAQERRFRNSMHSDDSLPKMTPPSPALNSEDDKLDQFLLDNESIVRQSIVIKKKGLFAKKRLLILTDHPRLIYLDYEKMIQKGEIPWSDKLSVEFKNKRNFFVHTPKRTYYLEDPSDNAQLWMDSINSLLNKKN